MLSTQEVKRVAIWFKGGNRRVRIGSGDPGASVPVIQAATLGLIEASCQCCHLSLPLRVNQVSRPAGISILSDRSRIDSVGRVMKMQFQC